MRLSPVLCLAACACLSAQVRYAADQHAVTIDGKPDLGVVGELNSYMAIFQNTSTPGSFTVNSFAPRVDFGTGWNAWGVASGDLDGDGRPDVVFGNYYDNNIQIYQNQTPFVTQTNTSLVVNGGFENPPGIYPYQVFDSGTSVPGWVVESGTVEITAGTYWQAAEGAQSLDLNGIFEQIGTIYQDVATTPGQSYKVRFAYAGNPECGSPTLKTANAFWNSQMLTNLSFDITGHTTTNMGWLYYEQSVTATSTNSRLRFQATSSSFCGLTLDDVSVTPTSAPLSPFIASQPTNLTVTVNTTATFAVAVTGMQPLIYQWSFNGTNLVGATNAILMLNNVQPSQAGNYTVVVGNNFGSVASSNAVLSVYVPPTPPTILSQTPNQVVLVGNPATFSVNASGSDPLSYFWSRNGALIPNATNSFYILANAQLADSGSKFSCLVTNAYGFAAGTNATLKVIDTVSNDLCSGAVVITSYNYTNTQSTAKASSFGDPVPGCVTGFGNGVWYQFTAPFNGRLLVDTFGSDFDTGLGIYAGACDALIEVDCSDDAGGVNSPNSQTSTPTIAGTTYSILVGGYSAHAGNLVIHVNYLTPPTFVLQPTNQSVVVSSNASFATTVMGTQPISFQWYFNDALLVDGGRISGATNTTLNLASVLTTDAGNYQLVASNFVGVTTSSVAVLTPVILPPVFVQQPVSQSIFVGSNANFAAVVDGTPPYSYQWYFENSPLADDGVHIFGSTTSSLSISNLTTADGGYYNLVVTNVSGMAVSDDAVLTVMVPPTILTQPVGRSVPPGLPTTFNFTASGNPIPSYHWLLNGTNVPGANTAVYTIPGVGTNQLGFYQVVASNSAGMATSSIAPLTFGPVAAWGRNLNNECLPPPGLSNVVSVAGTYQASFAVRADGTVAAWGSGSATNIPASASNVVALATSGSAGNYALRSDGRVVGWNGILPTALSNIVAVAAGNNFSYALRAEGTITNWGTIPTPGFPAGLSQITAIACGVDYAVALRSDGKVFVSSSSFGVSGFTTAVTNIPASATNVIAVAAGYTYAMALRADGKVIAWGIGTITNLPTSLTNIVAISAGNYSGENFGVAIRANGNVVTWGDNTFGESSPPTALTNLVSIGGAAAPFHGLALVNDGSPVIIHPPVGLTAFTGRDVTLHGDAVGTQPLSYQWLLNGTNIFGATNTSLVIPNLQLANAGNYQLFVSNSLSTALSLAAPLTVISNNTLTFLSQITASATNVYQGGKVSFGGATVFGSGPLRYQWFFSPTNKNYSAVAGATNDTFALDPALAVQSGNYYLAVSNGFIQFNQSYLLTSAPVNVRVQFARGWGFQSVSNPPVNLTNAVAIATGGYANYYGHYLALGADGKLTAWGNSISSYGETNVSALSNSFVTAIAAGPQHSLALKSDGTVYAWGYGGYGQTNPPANLNSVVAIACGGYHDLALKTDGTVVGWGASGVASPGQYNYGQATNNPAATNVVAIAAGDRHSLALRADGTVVGWGYSGDGSTTVPLTATNVIAIAAGSGFSVALRANGTVVQWGSGISQYPFPLNLSNIVAIAAASTHATALRRDGTVVAWGYEYTGLASNNVPPDLANVAAIASGGNHDFGLFGTRAPKFTVQPWNRTVFNTTTSVLFAAKCAAVQPVRYQWQLNGTNLPAATNDTLTVTTQRPPQGGPLPPLQSGVYQLIASNAYGVVTSKYAKLTVLIPLGDAVDAPNLAWTTTGNAQWFGQTNVTHDGVDAARSGGIGALQETILQTTFGTNKAGSYTFWWKVSSEAFFDTLEFRVNGSVQASISGEVDWQRVILPVAAGTNVLQWRYAKDASFDSGLDAGFVDQFAFVTAPNITRQPSSIANYQGTTAFFSVLANGASPMTYQWRKNGTNLANTANVSGVTTPVLTLGAVDYPDAGSYTVVITNLGGSVTSSPAVLTVLDGRPVIVSSPVSLTNNAGTQATFEVTATGTLLNYQWQKNGVSLLEGGNVSGSTTSLLTLADVQRHDEGVYTVIITNNYGSLTSSPALLAVIDIPPTITSQPANCTDLAGRTANFSVTASGTAPLNYQWQFKGTNVDGGTNALLTLINIQMNNEGPYQAVVTNAYGSVTSSVATLTLVHSMVVAWGDNAGGQTNVPPGLTNVVAIAAGGGHNLALQASGTVAAWGDNSWGQTNVPTGLNNVAAIAAGGYHNLVLQSNGTVTAWGENYYGQADIPPGLSNVMAIAAGGGHNLALLTNGTVVAWGANYSGQATVPAGLSNVVAIAAGSSHSCALLADGKVTAWGDDSYGQTTVPPGLSNVVAVDAGVYYSLALQANGQMVAWGSTGYGLNSVPPGLSNVVAIAAGGYHSLALQANGTVSVWGNNSDGETNVPAGLSNVVAISGGFFHCLALVSDNLTIATSPTITSQPFSLTVNQGTNVQFSVMAMGTPPLAYQWWQNGTNPVGGDSAMLTLTNASRAQNGIYSVLVTNASGGLFSSNAVLKVLVPQLLGSPKLLPDGSFQLTSTDANGGLLAPSDLANFEVQASTNLVNWVALPGALSLTNGMLQLQDNGSNYNSRYYRLIEH